MQPINPVSVSDSRMFLDIYMQVTGKVDEYQVVGTKNTAMLNIGSNTTTNYDFVVGVEG